ncbi:ROK family protein [Streptomyces sp. TLI_171]|uniref:ROK family protein n=1 Tax=Streptomyces sp. TLI_171 TaxID=1938859 RepID=UPI000C1A286D|nr:ROK family protein [Streptomyces sp. TLI_171]RKE17719.1 glucokinase [Streptomyces sp. TLI_171]
MTPARQDQAPGAATATGATTGGAVVAGVDIGGTKISAALVGPDGVPGPAVTVPTPAADGPAAVLAAVAAAVRALGGEPVAVGIGSAGVIDPAAGTVRSATDAMPGWAGTELRSGVEQLLGLPVAVDNDVHAHALGEAWTGAARGAHCVLLVAVGTGVGGSLLIDGRVHHGARQVAGHLGHIAVPEADGLPCTCGGAGHVEAVAAGPALLAAHHRAGGHPAADLRAVAERAADGEPLAAETLATGARALGRAIGGLANVLDPDLVLIGGGVSHCGPAWWEPLRTAFAAELLPPIAELPLTPCRLGTSAAVVGAARLAWRRLS